MIAVLTIIPLIVALWAVAWLAGFCGATLPKKSWKRLLIAVLVIGASLGIPALQVYLLTTLVSDNFAHKVFIYILVAEYVPGIALIFYAGFRGDHKKKRRDPTGSQSATSVGVSTEKK